MTKNEYYNFVRWTKGMQKQTLAWMLVTLMDEWDAQARDAFCDWAWCEEQLFMNPGQVTGPVRLADYKNSKAYSDKLEKRRDSHKENLSRIFSEMAELTKTKAS